MAQEYANETFESKGSTVSRLAIPSTANRILPYAFNGNTSLQKVGIPATVTEIGDYAFIGATDLRTIMNSATIPQQIDNTTFAGLNRSSMQLVVPLGKTQAYRNAGWTGFNIIESADTNWTENDDWQAVGSSGAEWWRGEDYFITLSAQGTMFNSNSQFRIRGANGMTIENNAAAPSSIGAGANSVSSYSATSNNSDLWYLSDTYTLYYGSGVVELSAVYSNGEIVLSATVLSEDNPSWYMWIAFGEGIIVEVYEPEPVWQTVKRIDTGYTFWEQNPIAVYGPGMSSIDQFRLRTVGGGPLEFAVDYNGPNSAGNIASFSAVTWETDGTISATDTASATNVWHLSDTFTFVSEYGTVQMWAEYTGTWLIIYTEIDVPLSGWWVCVLSELVLEVCV